MNPVQGSTINQCPPGNTPETPARQLVDMRIRLRPGLTFRRDEESGSVTIEDNLRGRFFEVGAAEYRVLQQFDGSRTVQAIAGDGVSTSPDRTSQVLAVGQWLVQNNLATVDDADNTARLVGLAGKQREQRMMEWLNPLSMKVRLFNPQPWLDRIPLLGKVLFSRWMFLAWLLLLTIAGACLFSRSDDIAGSYRGILAGSRWVWLLMAWVVLKVLHEAGHALACRRYGGRVTDSGVMFLFFTPLAWVDVSSCWSFPSRWQRIVVSAAGMYVELAVAAVAAIVWAGTGGESLLRDVCFQIVLMASLTTILFNANPLMKFDGYFILSDALGIANLYGKANQAIRQVWQLLFFGWPATPPVSSHRLERWFLRIYGAGTAVWRVLVAIGLLIAASVMFHGAGILLAMLAIAMWYVVPMVGRLPGLLRRGTGRTIHYPRLAAALTLLATAVAGAGFLLQSPSVQSAPAVVQLKDEQILRAPLAGFVREVLVHDGDRVVAGQPLVILRNPDLELKVRTLGLESEASRLKARSLLDQKKLAAWQAEVELANQLQVQLDESRKQLAAMTIAAPFDGIVFSRDLASLTGRYLEQGETALAVSRDTNREIVVSLDQKNSDALGLVAGHPMRAVFHGLPVASCPVARINPRADTRPLHLALCAAAGGPLPVRADVTAQAEGPSEPQLLSPRFNVSLTPDPELAERLFPGQTGWVVFASPRTTLGAWLWTSVKDALNEKIRLALSGQ